ncbi:phage holin family protein [Domibacillus sp. A3M-37]|uniref:phage holin family protein n=1 Tax=Domibacillus sp. A3M-37 TaxID=2962037 RepID=UPI0020B8F4C2|nr:phage holin family protein [Domibacillus sp. A3M-37]MCP3764084.1 phage holin family protein [Domibacillus sp. A3M-37]
MKNNTSDLLMQHNTDTLYNTIVGGGLSALAYLVGGMDQLFNALVIMMITDYVTGIMIAIDNKTLSSAIGFKGLMKKAAMMLAVVVAVQMDNISGTGGQFMRNTMIMFLIGMEGISFIENLGHLGVKVPKQISSVFAQLKEENETKVAPVVEVVTKTEITQKDVQGGDDK